MYGVGVVYGGVVVDFAALTVTATGMITALHITIVNTTAAILRPSEMLAFVLAAAMLPRLSSSFA